MLAMGEVLTGMLVLLHVGGILCQTATDTKNLKTDLFTTNAYNSDVRPVLDQSKPINVSTDFYLLAINELDEVSETLKTTGYLHLKWKDAFLAWNPASYGGITTLFIPQDNVWKPDVTLKNSIRKYEELGAKSLKMEISNDGTVEWYPFQVFESTCSIDITYFPFDQQICSMTFDPWSYYETQVLMNGGESGLSLEEYQKNSAWDISSTRWYINDEFSIVFEVTLDRKILHSLLTLVFPVILLAVLNLFVFALPSDGGEKAGYAVTVFLAFSVFMTIMAALFPKNSETVAYLSVFVVAGTLQSTLITIIALLMIRISSLDKKPQIPNFVLILARLLKCRLPRSKVNSERKEPARQETEIDQVSELTTDIDYAYTWKYVVDALDIFFFVFFLLSFLTVTLVCLLLAKKH